MINTSTLDDSRSSPGVHTPSLDGILNGKHFADNASVVLDDGMHIKKELGFIFRSHEYHIYLYEG
jgi:hypothetical protein